MINRFTDLKKQWLCLLPAFAFVAGLGAQCSDLPVFPGVAANVERPCGQFGLADLNALPEGNARCYRTDAATGQLIEARISDALRVALLAGGGIPAATSACGGEVEICVSDRLSSGPGCTEQGRIERTFTARNTAPDASTAPASRAQFITFVRPGTEDLLPVEVAVYYRPDDGRGVPENPAPRTEDYPLFRLADEEFSLSANGCNYQITYQDTERRTGCGNNFRFVRTFRITDVCEDETLLLQQIVKVGDQLSQIITPPPIVEYPLVFATDTECGAEVNLRFTGLTLADICDGNSGLDAFVYLDGDFNSTPLGPYAVLGANENSAISDPLPVGNHVVRYIGLDSYGAQTVLDIDFAVKDRTPPAIICRSSLTLELDADGRRVFGAGLLDAGTEEACGGFTLDAARADADNRPIGAFTANLSLTCADLGPVPILLRATDLTGRNRSQCLLTVSVSDGQAPVCTAPPAIEVSCRNFADNLPVDLTANFNADPETIARLLDETFGEARGVDNCGQNTVGQTVSGELSNCGTGRFVRDFTVTDGAGFTQNGECRQFIDVRAYLEYSIRMPADQDYTCAELPTPENLLISDAGCDLMAVTTQTDTLTPDANECYRLRRTYRIINWCEYDGAAEALEIPRNANGNDGEGRGVTLHIRAEDGGTLTDDRAVLDSDRIFGNGNELGPLVPNYAASGRRGNFTYVHYASVTDNTPPVIDLPEAADGLAFTDNCLGGVILAFTATDDCAAPMTAVAVDLDASDQNGDGLVDGADFNNDREIAGSRFFPAEDGGTEVFIRLLPIGVHLARVSTTDDCGNRAERYATLTVTDGRAPMPDCGGFSRVELAPDPDLGGIISIFATDFIAGPPVTCSEMEVNYAIYPETIAGEIGFAPNAEDVAVSFDCADLGDQLLRVYAISESTGRADFCNIAVEIAPGNGGLCDGRQGTILGTILTEFGAPMADVEVYLDGFSQFSTTSDADGGYVFDGLLEDRDFTVQPYHNDLPNNGVETFDIALLSELLTGDMEVPLTVYQRIAADANKSGHLTVLDLLSMRAVVLGIEANFDNNTSWRFVRADYDFPVPEDPWAEEFPEAYPAPGLSGEVIADFIAIKVGDLNNTARPSGLAGLPSNDETGRSTSSAAAVSLTWRADAPETGAYSLWLPEGVSPRGLQFSLRLPTGVEVVSEQTEELGFLTDRDGVLHVCYVPETRDSPVDYAPLLSLGGPPDATPPHILTNGARLQATLYPAAGPALPLTLEGISITETVPDLRVYPNPIAERSSLTFDWPVKEELTLTVSDLNGRGISQRGVSATKGPNMVTINGMDFAKAPGVYLLRLTGADQESTTRVVVTR